MLVTHKLTMRSLIILPLVLAYVASPALSAAPLGDDHLIDPIKFKISGKTLSMLLSVSVLMNPEPQTLN